MEGNTIIHSALTGGGGKDLLRMRTAYRRVRRCRADARERGAARKVVGRTGSGGKGGPGRELRDSLWETLEGSVALRRTKRPPSLSSQDILTAATFLSLALLLISLMHNMSAFYLPILDKSQQMGFWWRPRCKNSYFVLDFWKWNDQKGRVTNLCLFPQ